MVVRRGHRVEAESLTAFVRERIAAFKVPRHVTIVESLPRNAVGKVLKRELRLRRD